MLRNKIFVILALCSSFSYAETWCVFENFDVAISGNYVSVYGSSLSENGYVYLGDLDTEKGRAVHSLLLAAALSNTPVMYGHNGQDYKCGELPVYSTDTTNPQYLVIKTKK